jgi:hypothetical protein
VEVKRPGRESDYSPTSSAEFKECMELYLHSQIRLVKHRENFTLPSQFVCERGSELLVTRIWLGFDGRSFRKYEQKI